MQRTIFPQRIFSLPDILIAMLIAAVIYAVVTISAEWRAEYHPVTDISLSVWALPRYTLLSAVRGFVAYFFSLAFTLVVGYIAAYSRSAERIILPLLDVLQSIPVLGFLPGLVLGLVALFPTTNLGLELAAILLIFSGQVWNMVFSWYLSLKTVPVDLHEASTVMGLSRWQRLGKVELPFASIDLAWNSLMSMAGGWFFLTACEAGTIGDREFRLPGIGSYMAVAMKEGNVQAMTLGIIAMIVLIVSMDFFIWRPILAWVHRFRMEYGADDEQEDLEPMMSMVIRESRIVRWMKLVYRRYSARRLFSPQDTASAVLSAVEGIFHPASSEAEPPRRRWGPAFENQVSIVRSYSQKVGQRLQFAPLLILGLLTITVLIWGSLKLIGILALVDLKDWSLVFKSALFTFLRVTGSLILGSLWTIPFGIWVGVSPRRVRIAQPIIQICASFPAPMLFPLVLGVFAYLHIGFGITAMFLILMAVQWYILFNVLAGALRIPQELSYALSLMGVSKWERWKRLYFPSVFSSLVTGWVAAAGSAWNASVLAEYFVYKNQTLQTIGLGSTINKAAGSANFPLLAASLLVMVSVVVILNRTFWAWVYRLAQTRYRMDI